MDGAGRAVALLCDDDLGFALQVFVLAVVVFFAVDEADDVGVLLDGAGFAEVGEHGALVAGALFVGTRELGGGDDGDFELLGEGFEAAAYG